MRPWAAATIVTGQVCVRAGAAGGSGVDAADRHVSAILELFTQALRS